MVQMKHFLIAINQEWNGRSWCEKALFSCPAAVDGHAIADAILGEEVGEDATQWGDGSYLSSDDVSYTLLKVEQVPAAHYAVLQSYLPVKLVEHIWQDELMLMIGSLNPGDV